MAYKLIHYIIYYPMTTSFEYLITRSLLNTLLLSVCLESKKKYTDTYIMIQITVFFTNT